MKSKKQETPVKNRRLDGYVFILKAKNPQSRQYTYQFLVVMVHVAPLNYSKLWQTQGQTTLDIARQIVKYFKNYLKRDF